MNANRLSTVAFLLLLATSGFLFASQQPAGLQPESRAPSVPVDDDARAEAEWIYETRCAYCHGSSGRGDGEGAGDLSIAPGDLTRSDLLGDRDQGYVEKIILRGGPSVGRSPLMPPNPDLKAKPDVVAAIRDIVFALGRPQPER